MPLPYHPAGFISVRWGATYDPDQLTIEHVLPQTISEGSQWEKDWPDLDERKKWVHRLANLVLLTKGRNIKAKNYDFDKKKEAYFRGTREVPSCALTAQAANEDTWTPSVVEKRQEGLLKALVEGWELNVKSNR